MGQDTLTHSSAIKTRERGRPTAELPVAPAPVNAVDGKPSPASSRSMVALLLVVLWLTTGANFLGFRVAVESLPPFLMIGIRLVVAGLIMLPIAWLLGGWARPTSAQIRSILTSAVLLLALGQGALVWAVQTLPAGTTAMIGAAVPLWVAILGRILFGVHIGLRAKLGLALGFFGLILLAFTASGADGEFDFIAGGVMLAGTVAWALGALLDSRSEAPSSPALATALQMLSAGVILTIAAAVTGEIGEFNPSEVTMRSWTALAYLVVIGSIIGFGAFVWINRNTSNTVSSSFSYVSPVVALALSAWLLDEAVTFAKVAAGAISLVGVALMVSGGNDRTRERSS